MPFRSEMSFSPSFWAVDFNAPTALALAKGVGGNACTFSFLKSALACAYAASALAGTFSGSTPKNEVSAVLAYSG